MYIKSDEQIKAMKMAGKIVALAHQEVAKHIQPGISTMELDEVVENKIRSLGAKPSFKGYQGFPNATCISVNNTVVHGIPNALEILKEGDIVSIDIGADYNGYQGDSAWTYAVGEISSDDIKLMEVTKDALFKGLEVIKSGVKVGEISAAIFLHACRNDIGVVEELTGHGIGKDLHEDPYIPNIGIKSEGPILLAGHTIAVEPIFTFGNNEIYVEDDEWTIRTIDGKKAAHFEHTILITEDGYEILTKL